jgi:phosphatidylserine synthase 2
MLLDTFHAECHRYILFGARLGLVWESSDLTRLLVLLGKLQLSFCLVLRRLICLFEILSIAFELAEYSLQHQLPNFAEVCFFSYPPVMTQLSSGFQCWWDHVRTFHISPLTSLSENALFTSQWVLDVLICNWLGTYAG